MNTLSLVDTEPPLPAMVSKDLRWMYSHWAPATARCSCENWRSQHHCNKAGQEKQKFRIIHNWSEFLSTSLDTAGDSKSRFIFTASEE